MGKKVSKPRNAADERSLADYLADDQRPVAGGYNLLFLLAFIIK
jgi:hypothetical protein